MSYLPPALIDALPAEPGASPDSAFTRERQVAFLAALANCGAVRVAASRARISHQTAYRERLASPPFRRAWDAALVAARALTEEVLATRAIDGVEEEVFYHGEVVASRRRYDGRLLLAHLARLDRLTRDVRVEEFAEDFEAALGRFGEGSDAPEQAPDAGEDNSSPGQWSTRSTPPEEPEAGPCPECGGRCLDPDVAIARSDCPVFDARVEEMWESHPPDEPWLDTPPGYDAQEFELAQLAAFETGAEHWWLTLPPKPRDAGG